VLAVCVWASRAAAGALGEQLRFGVWLCGMMLLSPSNGAYTFVVLLMPLLAVLRYLELNNDRRIRAWLIVGTALVCWPPAWTDWNPWLYNTLHVRFGLLLLTPAIYGLVIYVGLLAYLVRSERAACSVQPADASVQ
jgi:hypothetical protein